MVATVMHLLANLDRGGAQEVVRTLVQAQPATGWRPIVAAFRDGPLRPEIEAAGVQVRLLPGRAHSLASPVRALAELRSLRNELRRLIDEEDVDVVQTHLLGSLDFVTVAARHGSAPVVLWTVHNALLDLRADQLPVRPALAPRCEAGRLPARLSVRRTSGGRIRGRVG